MFQSLFSVILYIKTLKYTASAFKKGAILKGPPIESIEERAFMNIKGKESR